MSEQKIRNMRIISDDPELLHLSSFTSEPIGQVEEFHGKKYRVIDNWKTTIVSYEPVEEDE